MEVNWETRLLPRQSGSNSVEGSRETTSCAEDLCNQSVENMQLSLNMYVIYNVTYIIKFVVRLRILWECPTVVAIAVYIKTILT